jgi:predicted secreted hydrolase
MNVFTRFCCLSRWLSGCLIVLLIGVLSLVGLGHPAEAASTQLHWLEATPATGFEKALVPKQWQFPDDFGAHEGYQTEWWYYTGNLETAEGRPFGFQLTFFRQALSPAVQVNSSHWRSNQIYSAHFTVSDIAERQFYPYERFSRGAVGLAGAEAKPYQVWLENWSATEVGPAAANSALGKVRLQAEAKDVAIDLTVEQTLPPILQGNRGLSIKGLEPGNASYYYSLVQQPTAGSITVKGQPYQVTGLTWKDHEYSTSALTPGTVGWDWFSMQFNDGSALMLYLLRHDDGTLEPTSAGTFIAETGETTPISWKDWQVEVLDTWKSTESEAVYPAKWHIKIPKLNIALQAQSLMPNQELNVATATYWEGAVAFNGTRQGKSLHGEGYVELTGYAGRLDALLSARTP